MQLFQVSVHTVCHTKHTTSSHKSVHIFFLLTLQPPTRVLRTFGHKVICGEKLSINHILIQCEDIRSLFPVELKLPHTLEEFSYKDYLTLAKILIYSPIGSFL